MALTKTKLIAGGALVAAMTAGGYAALPAFSSPKLSADVRIEMSGPMGSGVGSGVQVAPGFVITNNHVACDGATTIKIVDRQGVSYDAGVLWCNKDYDLAALQFNNEFGKVGVAELDCREPAIGETIRSVGNPAGLKFMTMNGRIAGAAQSIGDMWESVMLVDMTMIAGMSGGAAYGEDGKVVGINAGTLAAAAPTGGLPSQGGLSMVIPAKVVCSLTGRA